MTTPLTPLPSVAAPTVLSTSGAMHKVMLDLVTSGLSVGLANTLTNPLDVIKVRMQLQQRGKALSSAATAASAGSAPPSARFNGGLVRTGLDVVRNEGMLALWSGIGPSVARGFFFGGARLGLYTPIKSAVSSALCSGNSSSSTSSAASSSSSNSFEIKVLSGSLSGGLAAAVTSPIELIKTRLQAAGATAASSSTATPSTSLAVIRSVVASEGVAGLWKGALPGLYRSAILTACQCATYDEVKRFVVARTGGGKGDSVGTHLVSSMIAGLVTTTVTAPFDVVKTRMFLSSSSAASSTSAAGRYSGRGAMARCAADVMRTEGMAGFFRGWTAAYARLGPHTVIMFLAAERLRKFAGLEGL